MLGYPGQWLVTYDWRVEYSSSYNTLLLCLSIVPFAAGFSKFRIFKFKYNVSLSYIKFAKHCNYISEKIEAPEHSEVPQKLKSSSQKSQN